MPHQDNNSEDQIVGKYHQREDWILWEGIEIENTSLSGIRTLFVGDAQNSDLTKEVYGWYIHVFFNPIFIQKNGYEKIIEILKTGIRVTVSLTPTQLLDIDQFVAERATIMLCIEVDFDSLKYLKPLDTIKIQFGDMDNNVLDNITFLVKEGKISKTDDYVNDVKVK